MPVHLGSMGESVKTIIDRRAGTMRARRRVRAQRALQRRHASARRDGDRAGVSCASAFRQRPVAAGRLRRAAEDTAAQVREGDDETPLPRSSTSPRAATTPTSAASRRARCRPTRTHVEEEGVLLDNVQLVAAGPLPRRRDAHDPARRGAIRRATSSRTSPTCARRWRRAPRAPTSSRRWSRTSRCRWCAPTCSTCRTTPRKPCAACSTC